MRPSPRPRGCRPPRCQVGTSNRSKTGRGVGPILSKSPCSWKGNPGVWTSRQLSHRLRFCAHTWWAGVYPHRPMILMPRISAPSPQRLQVANLRSGRAEGHQGLRAWVQIPPLLRRGRMSPCLSEPAYRSVKLRPSPCLVLRALSEVTKSSAPHDSGGGSWLPETPFLGLKRNQAEPLCKACM